MTKAKIKKFDLRIGDVIELYKGKYLKKVSIVMGLNKNGGDALIKDKSAILMRTINIGEYDDVKKTNIENVIAKCNGFIEKSEEIREILTKLTEK